MRSRLASSLAAAFFALAALPVAAQDDAEPQPASHGVAEPAPDPGPWNRFGTRWVTFQPTGAIALDFVRYTQDDTSIVQVGDLTVFEVPEVRAIRAGVLGTLNFEKPWLFYIAGAYRGFGRGFDREKDSAWGLFDLSLTIPIPKLGRVTLGKAKEPFSMERIMGGGVQPGIERAMGTDALTAARNAGIQFKNSFANDRMTWASGVFNDWLFNEERLESASTQVIGRLTGLPMDQPGGAGLLHLGLAGRYSNVKPGVLRFENSPEVFSSPLFVDTEEFSAEGMTHINLEAYYQKGPFWLGTEQIYTFVRSPENGDPLFRSVFAQATWVLNGASRPYRRQAGIFGALRPRKTVTDRGAGLFEVGARYSMVDLEDGEIRGGEMSRLNGIANWYLTGGVLASFNYGLVRLDRKQRRGRLHERLSAPGLPDLLMDWPCPWPARFVPDSGAEDLCSNAALKDSQFQAVPACLRRNFSPLEALVSWVGGSELSRRG